MISVLFPRSDPAGGIPGAAELGYQLRGAPVFDYLIEMGIDIALPVPAENGGNTVPMPLRRGKNLVFASLSMLVDNPSAFDRIITMGVPLIVDVHFPLGDPDAVLAIQPGRTDETRDVTLDRHVAELWAQPDRIAAALDVIRAASAVTSPRKAWAALLRTVTDAPVFVVPDVVDPQSGGVFAREFMRAMRKAAGVGRLKAILPALAAWPLAGNVRRELERSGIDWAARRAGGEP